MKVRRGAEPFVLEKHSNYVYIGSLQRDRLAMRPRALLRPRSRSGGGAVGRARVHQRVQQGTDLSRISMYAKIERLQGIILKIPNSVPLPPDG